MKTKFLFLFFAFSFSNLSQSQTLINVYDNVLFYDGYAGLVSAPTEPNVVRLRNDLFTTKLTSDQLSQIGSTLRLDVLITAACDNYDRIGNVNLVLVPKNDATYNTSTALKIEMGRFITPFMNKNISPFSVPYTFTVDNVAKIMKDTAINSVYDFWVELEVFGVPYAANTQVAGCSGRNDVFYGTLDFVTNEQTTAIENNFLLPLNFKKDLNNYNVNATDVVGQTVRTINYSVPESINNASYYIITSNHGANAGGEEYNRRFHYIYHDTNLKLTYKPGELTCEPYRIYNTQGNGIYSPSPRTPGQWQSFSNWCPGAVIPIRTIALGTLAAGSHTFKIDVPTAVFANGEGYIPVSVYVQGENSTLSINDVVTYSYDMYPNPTSNTINISGTDIINSYQIIDSLGRVLVSYTYNTSNLSIDLSSYANGVYFLKMNFDKGTNTERIIKQ
ncbi:peptide-N-glycosidase F-related protein [Flavobacterium sp.]